MQDFFQCLQYKNDQANLSEREEAQGPVDVLDVRVLDMSPKAPSSIFNRGIGMISIPIQSSAGRTFKNVSLKIPTAHFT